MGTSVKVRRVVVNIILFGLITEIYEPKSKELAKNVVGQIHVLAQTKIKVRILTHAARPGN